MRIIAGRFRSRVLKPVPGFNTRPTPDRLREALFNVLTPFIEDCVFLDAYAGTGAVGIEALSRGAKHAILIERHKDALAVIRENLNALHIAGEATVVQGAAKTALKDCVCDIAFLDPPYEETGEYVIALNQLSNCKLVIAQHASRFVLDESYGPLRKYRVLRQGDNSLSFFELESLP